MKSLKQIEIKIETITPEYASQLLMQNTGNRNISKNYVSNYAHQMQNGLWDSSACDPIRISSTGEIIDGQHRLSAIIKSGTSQDFIVYRNVPDDARYTFDQGKSRTASDAMKIHGVKNAVPIASIMNKAYKLRIGVDVKGNRAYRLSNMEHIKMYDDNPAYWDELANKAQVWYNAFSKVATQAYIGGFYERLSDIDREDAEIFINKLCRWVGLSDNDPIRALRNILVTNKMDNSKTLSDSMIIALTYKAWNKFRMKEDCVILRYSFDRESYPEPI